MKYCVLKDTTIVIDGSLNTDEIMFENAVNSGFSIEQVEILTKEQYDDRKTLENSEHEPSEIEKLKIRQSATEDALLFIMEMGLM